ncbi:MAG: site-2 protease family protein [Candidatus Diapherotrites archaeon]|nr:site-2 protease family protein [Candidatus Diapherotrites archaeon]
MKSLSLGKIFGIRLELHWSFVLIGLFVVGMLALIEPALLAPMLMVFFFLFLSVFLHELVHCVVSLQRGIGVQKIILLPIGGVSLTESLPEKAKDEFLIAVSGPAFNFLVVFAVLFLVSVLPLPFPRELLSNPNALNSSEAAAASFLSMPLFTVFWVNLALGTFNLFLPALPLDGGRVFRSLLSFAFGYRKATAITTRISSLIAVLLFVSGFLSGNILLLVIAAFVFFGSKEEEKIVQMKEELKGITLSRVISEKPLVLDSLMNVREAFEKMLEEKKTEAVTEIEPGRFAVLLLEEMPSLVGKKTAPLYKALKETPSLQISESPSKAFERMASAGKRAIPVLDGSTLAGIIDLEKIEMSVMLSRANAMLGEKPPEPKTTPAENPLQPKPEPIPASIIPENPNVKKKKARKPRAKRKDKPLKKQNRK